MESAGSEGDCGATVEPEAAASGVLLPSGLGEADDGSGLGEAGDGDWHATWVRVNSAKAATTEARQVMPPDLLHDYELHLVYATCCSDARTNDA